MMKNSPLILVLVLTFFTINIQTTNAQEKRLNSSPPAFRTFFSKFKTAVERSDKTAVASITSFPFRYGFDAGDEGTMSRSQFIKGFSRIFGRSPGKFFTEKKPLFTKDRANYTVSTEDAAHLTFVRKGSGFTFTSYIVES